MQNKEFHALSIINNEVKLDNFTVNGVLDYTLKGSGSEGTKINMTLLVKSQDVVVTGKAEQTAPEAEIQEQSREVIKPLENTEFIDNLAQSIIQCINHYRKNHGTNIPLNL